MDSPYAGSVLRVVAGLAGVGILAVVTNWPAVALLPVAVSFVAAETYLLVERRFDLNRGWVKHLAGSGVVAVGAWLLVGSGTAVAAAVLLAGGAWLAADGAYDLRHGDLTVWHVDSLQYYRDRQAVRRALAERPRDVDALAADLDTPTERVEATVEVLRRRGRVEATPSGYRLREPGPLGWVGPALARAARRLARPLGWWHSPAQESPSRSR